MSCGPKRTGTGLLRPSASTESISFIVLIAKFPPYCPLWCRPEYRVRIAGFWKWTRRASVRTHGACRYVAFFWGNRGGDRLVSHRRGASARLRLFQSFTILPQRIGVGKLARTHPESVRDTRSFKTEDRAIIDSKQRDWLPPVAGEMPPQPALEQTAFLSPPVRSVWSTRKPTDRGSWASLLMESGWDAIHHSSIPTTLWDHSPAHPHESHRGKRARTPRR